MEGLPSKRQFPATLNRCFDMNDSPTIVLWNGQMSHDAVKHLADPSTYYWFSKAEDSRSEIRFLSTKCMKTSSSKKGKADSQEPTCLVGQRKSESPPDSCVLPPQKRRGDAVVVYARAYIISPRGISACILLLGGGGLG